MRKITGMICMLAWLFVAPAGAIQLPDHYPDEGFDRIGNIDSLNLQSRKIVVNDVEYILPEDVIVHSFSRSHDSLARLVEGYKLGFNLRNGATGRYVQEIWLLPGIYEPTEASVKSYDRPLKPGLLK